MGTVTVAPLIVEDCHTIVPASISVWFNGATVAVLTGVLAIGYDRFRS